MRAYGFVSSPGSRLNSGSGYPPIEFSDTLKIYSHKKNAKLTFAELHTPEYGLRCARTPARDGSHRDNVREGRPPATFFRTAS
jgi:hypothetical protein